MSVYATTLHLLIYLLVPHLSEIAQLERSQRLANPNGGGFAAGPAVELTQLTATPWPKLLDANCAWQRRLLRERERYQLAVERVTGQLAQAR